MQHVSMMSETDYQMLMNSAFIGIADNNSGAIPVSGRLTLATKGYKLIDDIPVSPYQSLMFPLKRRKRQGSSRKSRKQSASGFRYVVANVKCCAYVFICSFVAHFNNFAHLLSGHI